MLHTDLTTSSTLRARAQKLRFPGCPQLQTNGSPLQGPCHLWDPHITILLILNLPLIQTGSQSICGLVSHFSLCSPSTVVRPCWPPCYSEHACQACFHFRYFACCSFYPECYSPLILHAASLISKCQLTDTIPDYFLFLPPTSCLIFIPRMCPPSDILSLALFPVM